ncbi:MAG TPA: ABC transporter permease [Spirochaetia bacterium]|nr:ABC transporter permease [Spirochaetia bacterium]
MKERLLLCLRNLARHGWRTRIILLIALFGSFLTFLFENLIEDVSRKQSDMFGRSFSGHFMVVHRDIEMGSSFGFYHYEPEEMLQPDEIASVKQFLSGIPEVSGSQERIVFGGLLYAANDSERGFRGVAMDMAAYNRNFTDLYYQRGTPLAAGETDACAASWYEYQRDKIVDVGKRYVFLVPNRDGEFVDRFVTVKGGIDYRTMPRDVMGLSAVFFDLDGYRSMVGYTRPLASEVVGFLRDARSAGRVLPRIDAFLRQNHPRLKVVSWREYAPIFAEIVLGFDVMMKAVEAVLLAICVLLVVKLTTFSIIERYSEIGTMRALGFSRADIALQFALEGFLIIAAGSIVGFLLAGGLISLFHATGVKNSVTFFAWVIGDGFRPSLHAGKVLAVAAVFAAVAVLAPLLPALQGARLSILRTLEKR